MESKNDLVMKTRTLRSPACRDTTVATDLMMTMRRGAIVSNIWRTSGSETNLTPHQGAQHPLSKEMLHQKSRSLK
jgi:hypothetical protein